MGFSFLLAGEVCVFNFMYLKVYLFMIKNDSCGDGGRILAHKTV